MSDSKTPLTDAVAERPIEPTIEAGAVRMIELYELARSLELRLSVAQTKIKRMGKLCSPDQHMQETIAHALEAEAAFSSSTVYSRTREDWARWIRRLPLATKYAVQNKEMK